MTSSKERIQHKEIADHAWATPEEMEEYDITEADLPFIEKLKFWPYSSLQPTYANKEQLTF